MQISGLPTGKYLQGEDSAKWMSENSLGSLKEELERAEGEDQITLLETFQQSKLEDVKVNVTEWITSLIRQRVKLQNSITQ